MINFWAQEPMYSPGPLRLECQSLQFWHQRVVVREGDSERLEKSRQKHLSLHLQGRSV